MTVRVTRGHTAQHHGTAPWHRTRARQPPPPSDSGAGRVRAGWGAEAAAKRPARSRTEPREVAMNKGSDEWAPRCALFYSAVTKALATMSMNQAALPAKPKKYNLWGYVGIDLFHERWR